MFFLAGGVACLISIIKPDPKSDVERDIKRWEHLGRTSIYDLLNSRLVGSSLLPLVSAHNDKFDWVFENNQGATAMFKGSPENHLKFNLNGYTQNTTCPNMANYSNCFGIGESRVLGKFLSYLMNSYT